MDFLANIPFVNLIAIMVFILVILIILIFFLKGKKLKVGNTEISNEKEKEIIVSTTKISEREIIKKQIHIARAVCSNFKTNVPHYKEYSEAQIENICYKVSDEIEDLILFNHLSTDDDYIESRFQLIWAVITDNLNNNFTDEDKEKLKEIVIDDFRKLIKLLLSVRQEIENGQVNNSN